MRKITSVTSIFLLLLSACGPDEQYSTEEAAADVSDAQGAEFAFGTEQTAPAEYTDAIEEPVAPAEVPVQAPQEEGMSGGEALAVGAVIVAAACLFFCSSSEESDTGPTDQSDSNADYDYYAAEQERARKDEEDFYRLQKQQETIQEYSAK